MRRSTLITAALLVVALCAADFGIDTAAALAPTVFTVSGGGYGHGVGMSQFGARGRSDAGQTAAQILDAYYPGATLATIAQPTIRVKLGDTPSFVVSGPALTAAPDGGAAAVVTAPAQSLTISAASDGTITAQAAGAGVVVLVGVGGVGTVDWVDGESALVSSFGHHYRHGRLVVRSISTGSLDVVLDQLPMQRYIDGLAEVSSSWPTEALRAQAIAGRTFAAYRLAHPQSSRFDIYASVSDQAFVGDDKASGALGDRWVAAVADTSDQVVTSGGVAIQAFYSSSNGGYSEASGYVFVTAQAYLPARPDPYDQAAGNSNFAWTESYTGEELAAWLTAAGRPSVGSITAVSIGAGVGASGRVDRATIMVQGASGGSFTLTGNQFRSAVNTGAPSNRDLLSTKFSLSGVGLAGGNPVGANEAAVPWGANAALVTGWAADPDVPTQPALVHVYVNGRFAMAVTADRNHPALGRSAPWFGPAHGWAAIVDAPGSSAQICAFAINFGAGTTNPLLGCRTVVRSAPKAAASRRSRRSRRAAARARSVRHSRGR